MQLFCLQLEASCLQWSFLLTIDNFSLLLTVGFFAYNFSFLTYNWSFFVYNEELRLIRGLRDCKQRSLTVSKKAPTVSRTKKNFPRNKSQTPLLFKSVSQHEIMPCVSKQCPADGVWRIGSGEGLQTGFSRHGLPIERAPLDTVFTPSEST